MRTFIAFGLAGTLATTAWANPAHDHIPPGALRTEVQMRMPVDGRADTASPARESRPSDSPPSQRAQKPADRAPSSAQTQLPLKSDIAQKVHPGDQREVTGKPQALDARALPERPSADRMGRAEPKPQLPIKTEITMKAQHGGDSRDASSSPSGSAAKDADRDKARKSARNPLEVPPPRLNMSGHDREMLCRQTGVCLPQSQASDDVEAKTE